MESGEASAVRVGGLGAVVELGAGVEREEAGDEMPRRSSRKEPPLKAEAAPPGVPSSRLVARSLASPPTPPVVEGWSSHDSP